jgi:hypothetical protein
MHSLRRVCEFAGTILLARLDAGIRALRRRALDLISVEHLDPEGRAWLICSADPHGDGRANDHQPGEHKP